MDGSRADEPVSGTTETEPDLPGDAPADSMSGTVLGAAEAAVGGIPEAASASEDLAAQYLDQLQRLKAEFDNYRKRNAREREGWWRDARPPFSRTCCRSSTT
jgi:molecular chaperone GrpE (heat shock protein)